MAPLGVRRLHHRDVWSLLGRSVRPDVEVGMTRPPRLTTRIPTPLALAAVYLAAFLIWRTIS